MRRRAYLYWLLVVGLISLVPAVVFPDILEASLRHRPAVNADVVMARVYDALTKWPIWAYQTVGGRVRPPLDWPVYLQHGVMMIVMLVPFWFLFGVPLLELSLWLRRRAHASAEGTHA